MPNNLHLKVLLEKISLYKRRDKVMPGWNWLAGIEDEGIDRLGDNNVTKTIELIEHHLEHDDLSSSRILHEIGIHDWNEYLASLSTARFLWTLRLLRKQMPHFLDQYLRFLSQDKTDISAYNKERMEYCALQLLRGEAINPEHLDTYISKHS